MRACFCLETGLNKLFYTSAKNGYLMFKMCLFIFLSKDE